MTVHKIQNYKYTDDDNAARKKAANCLSFLLREYMNAQQVCVV